MPKFSQRSLDVLNTCDPRLQVLCRVVVQSFDCAILPDGGVRTPERQQQLFDAGKSKTLQSKHLPDEHGKSHAVDMAPYPIDWNDTARFYTFGCFVRGVAAGLGIKLRWGGDWDGDWTFTDQKFHDLPHFELDD